MEIISPKRNLQSVLYEQAHQPLLDPSNPEGIKNLTNLLSTAKKGTSVRNLTLQIVLVNIRYDLYIILLQPTSQVILRKAACLKNAVTSLFGTDSLLQNIMPLSSLDTNTVSGPTEVHPLH